MQKNRRRKSHAWAPLRSIPSQSVATLTVCVGEWGGGLSLCVRHREDFKNWVRHFEHEGLVETKCSIIIVKRTRTNLFYLF
jgi:hypothetical protein